MTHDYPSGSDRATARALSPGLRAAVEAAYATTGANRMVTQADVIKGWALLYALGALQNVDDGEPRKQVQELQISQAKVDFAALARQCIPAEFLDTMIDEVENNTGWKLDLYPGVDAEVDFLEPGDWPCN